MKSIVRKTLLYKTDVEYGDFTINHVQGCYHGCMFPCYAFQMAKRFGNVKAYQEWLEPKIVSNALELLDKEIPKYKSKIKNVQLSFTTDPFMMNYPEVSNLSIKIINKLNDYSLPAVILTKGIIPKEALSTKKYNQYGITLISLNEEFRKKYEPNTSTYFDRIQSLKQMHNAGFKTWVSIEPYPTPNVVEQDLALLLNEISFVDYIVFGMWHYNKIISEYKDKKKFYNNCSDIVIKFCEKNEIKYHIKKGTIFDID